MPELSTEARQHLAHLGRKQVKAFAQAALEAAEMWEHYENDPLDKVTAFNAVEDLKALLEDLGE